jgi:hypothetical protein
LRAASAQIPRHTQTLGAKDAYAEHLLAKLEEAFAVRAVRT